MIEKQNKPAIAEVTIISAMGIAGVLGFFYSMKWLFYICSIPLACLFVFNVLVKAVRSDIWPYWVACMAWGYSCTPLLIEAVALGFCFYYATVWLYSLIVRFFSEFLIVLVVAVCGILSFLFTDFSIAIPMGCYCLTMILITLFTGKMPVSSFFFLVASIGLAVLLRQHYSRAVSNAGVIVSCFLFAACAFYTLTSFYIIAYKMIYHKYPNYLADDD